MNRIPSTGIRLLATRGTTLLWSLLLAMLWGCNVPASEAEADEPAPERSYRLDYRVRPDPAARGAHVEMTVTQRSHLLREIDMSLRDGKITDVSGDGDVSTGNDRVIWTLPETGGQLRWFALIDNQRDGETYDAHIDEDWALFRGMDVMPSASTRARAGAESRTRLLFDLPDGWSSVTPYFGRDDVYEVDNPERNFDTPIGWIVLGDIGVRNDTVGHVRTKVAGPTGHSIRRMDILALMRWTLPELLRLLPDFPDRLTIVSAGEPMWRGALSAPDSIYVHADRPLISENATSTLLHETMHVGLGLTAAPGADWIVEGLAEYYSLEILRRTGTISEKRYRDAHEALDEWGRKVGNLCRHRSSGSNTARAVTILAKANGEIRKASRGKADMDDVLRVLASRDEKVTVEQFRDIVSGIAGEAVDALNPRKLPGCSE